MHLAALTQVCAEITGKPLPEEDFADGTVDAYRTVVEMVTIQGPDCLEPQEEVLRETLARCFVLRHRRGFLLTEWIRQAEQDAPKPDSGFAGFLRQDLDAVTAGLTLQWSSGVVEGHVNRVKILKRAMYGRASFTLLRTRILTKS
ncbi:transposase [Streptomyces virginiae]|uniref:transposase n=2 Tax=Streptomyces virginiae TaxID=1961 RepID=UPI0036DFD659